MRMSSGQTARFEYSYLAERDLDRIEARLMMQVMGEERATIRFDSARIRFIPEAGGPRGLTKRDVWLRPKRRAAQRTR